MSRPTSNIEEQIQYISDLYGNEFTVSDLGKIRTGVINMAYDYLKSLENYHETTSNEGKKRIKEQLQQLIIDTRKEEDAENLARNNQPIYESSETLPLEQRIRYISELYGNEFTVLDLEKIRADVMSMAYDYLKSLETHQESIADEGKQRIKEQLQQLIIDRKEEDAANLDRNNRSVYESSDKPDDFEKNKKIINNLFLDLFYDSFILFKKSWGNMSDDDKKRKDYFRYLEEKLSSIDGISSIKNGYGLVFKNLNNLTEQQKEIMRPIISNSFLIGETEEFVAPAVYANTYELDAYRRYIDEIMYPASYVGGNAKKITHVRLRKSIKRSRSACSGGSNRRHRKNRHRRTARK